MLGNFTQKCFAVIVSSLILTAAANAGEWRIVQSRGQIWLGSDTAQPASLGSTSTVPDGATVITGERGRAMLRRGTETMVIGPNAVVTVPKGGAQDYTTILQQAGKVVFDVDRRNVKHFAVETPYLAAVVKGTRFNVQIESNGAVVSVTRGSVEVTSLATGDTVDTARGQRATVNGPKAELTIAGFGKLADIKPGKPRGSLIDPLSPEEVLHIEAPMSDAANGLALGLTARGGHANGNAYAYGHVNGNGNGDGKGNGKGN